MEEEGDGGTGGGFGYVNLPKNPFVYTASPPLTAIDRFLLGQNNFSYQNQLGPTILKNKDYSFVSSNGPSEFSSSNSSSGGAIGGVLWPSFCSDGISFTDDEEIEKLTKDLNSDASAKDEGKSSSEENSRGKGKKLVKGGNSMALIKGQWTDEEDRKLVRLVKQFGVRKWAQIAEKMVGRAGKQCRERWHNHLRPDIKKDTWSEEEERMLVEAHQIVGNKWAEIAKWIPGRTENSIKNHWNATKRRQNARRNKSGKKIRKNDKCSQSSFLQDYIKSQTNFNDTNFNYPNAAVSSTATSAILDDPLVQINLIFPELSQSTSDDSPSLMNNTCDDDELNFMQNLFGNNNNNYSNYEYSSSSLSHQDNNFSMGLNNNLPKEEAKKTHLYSDLYLSYLLDGSTTTSTSTTTLFSPNDCNFNGIGDMKMDFKLNQEEGSSSQRKEMDLMEMVSSSKFYIPYN